MTDQISREEFIDRFVARILKKTAPHTAFDDGTTFEEYARDVAQAYWDEPDQREDGPEASADADMDCWGDT